MSTNYKRGYEQGYKAAQNDLNMELEEIQTLAEDLFNEIMRNLKDKTPHEEIEKAIVRWMEENEEV